MKFNQLTKPKSDAQIGKLKKSGIIIARRLEILCVTYLVLLYFGFRFMEKSLYHNTSISEPPGYYLALSFLPVHRGSLVLMCVNDNKYRNVLKKLGLNDAKGECSNGMTYLLKQVVATTGDTVEVVESGIKVNGVLYRDSIQFKEGKGVNLYPLPVGYSHVLTSHEYFVLGRTTHSVDSRYFGVINESDIYSRVILIFRDKLK